MSYTKFHKALAVVVKKTRSSVDPIDISNSSEEEGRKNCEIYLCLVYPQCTTNSTLGWENDASLDFKEST